MCITQVVNIIGTAYIVSSKNNFFGIQFGDLIAIANCAMPFLGGIANYLVLVGNSYR